MLGSILRVRPYLVGLDIGSSYIKVLELTRERKGLLLGKIGCVRLNPECIVEKEIIDSREVAREIRSLLPKSSQAAGKWPSPYPDQR